MRAELAILSVSITVILSWASPASSSAVLVDPEIATIDAFYERAACPGALSSAVQEIQKLALAEDRKSWIREHAVRRLGDLARNFGSDGAREVLESIVKEAGRASSLGHLVSPAAMELARLDLFRLEGEQQRVEFLRRLVVEPIEKYRGTNLSAWAAEELCALGDDAEIEQMKRAFRSLSVSGSEEAVSLCLKQIELVQGAKNRVEAWSRALELKETGDIPLEGLRKWATRELISHKGQRSDQILLALGSGQFGEHLSSARRVEALRELRVRGFHFEELKAKGADPRLLFKAGLAPAEIMKQLTASKADPCPAIEDV